MQHSGHTLSSELQRQTMEKDLSLQLSQIQRKFYAFFGKKYIVGCVVYVVFDLDKLSSIFNTNNRIFF